MFHFDIAIPALAQGLTPDSFGSDLHRSSMNGGMRSMIETMSKFLNMGMSLSEVINVATWSSAQAIKRPDLGNLSVGSEADIAIISIRKGNFGFLDTRNQRLSGDRRLEAEMTIRAGRIVWDFNGMAGRDLQ
jgi:dihydroorotase